MDEEIGRELRADGFALIETHISRVFLRGDDVYKLKRPVSLGFLDFSTIEARARACRAEVALNRRLAPDVYLGVVAVVRTADGKLAFEPSEQADTARVLEWAVHMRRLRDEDRADVQLAAGTLADDAMERIATLLARFHGAARADDETAAFGRPEAIAENVEENFAQIAGTFGAYLSPAEQASLLAYQREFLRARGALLARRARDGFVRDGHGDLRLEHLYRTAAGDYVAIDCIEFNDRFRYADVCADLAFLAMDLAYHGRVDLSERLIARYAEETRDYGLYALLDFYQSYRAVVRAKVASILADDAHVASETRERARREARRYYLLALAESRRPLAPPRVIVSFGLIASGKSTLARALATSLAVPVLSADATRKELLEKQPTEPLHDAAFGGAYAPAVSERVYETLFARAAQVVASGRSVVLDATFRARAHREAARALAASCGVELVLLECRCPRDVALARLARRAEGPSISDGRAEIYDDFAASFEPVGELAPGEHVALDTSGAIAQTLAAALARLDA